MERGGGGHSSSWPATIRTPAHPQHELEYISTPATAATFAVVTLPMHLHLNLSAQFNILDHQNDGETTLDVDPSSRQSYHVALQYNSSDDRGEEVADVLAVNYNNLQQQDYPTTDDDGEDNQRARDFGDLDGDDEPRDFGNADGNDEQRDMGNVDGDDAPSNFDIIDAGNYARESADGDYYGSDMYD
ncbi:unnamed protein product [Urochloa humidicola]